MDKNLISILENQVLTLETKQLIQEAWIQQLEQSKHEITHEVRQEFAKRYDHDKMAIVEAMDQKINESLLEKMAEISQQKENFIAEQISYKKSKRTHAEKFLFEATQVLSKEVSEFRKDQKNQNAKLKEFVEFIAQGVKSSVTESYQEQNIMISERVKMKANHQMQVERAVKTAVNELAIASEKFLTSTLTDELSQLKEELTESRKNSFGKKIFEAFMGEFSNNFHDSNTEIKKMTHAITQRDKKIAESNTKLSQSQKQLDQINNKLKITESNMNRQKVLGELLGSLGKNNKIIMEDMLEKIPTNRLAESFNRYLPMLLEENNKSHKSNLTEGKRHLTDKNGEFNHKVAEKTNKIVENVETVQNSEADRIINSFNKIKTK